MDELEISGKRYISTKRAGKEHKYHSDYIGQLIRGGKVVGQKVGRSWYVDEESLTNYLSNESKEKQAPVVKAEPKPTVKVVEQVVEKVEEPKQIEIVKEEPKIIERIVEKIVYVERPKEEPIREEEVTTIPVSIEKKKIGGLTYLPDEGPLMPEIHTREEFPEETFNEQIESDILYKKDIEPRRSKRGVVGQLATLTVVGVVFGMTALGVSYLLVYKSSIDGGDAKAGIGLTQLGN